SFTVDGTVGSFELDGALASGAYQSNPPATGVPPTKLNVRLACCGDVPLIGVHVTFSATTDKLVQGRIHGAIVQSDVYAIVVPSLAQRLDALGKQMPCSSVCAAVLQVFDTNQDGTISPQEVQSNGIIQSVLSPDVELLDASGNFSPNAANASPDSLSLGI